MGLVEWIDDHTSKELRTLADSIEAGDVADERVEALRELIDDADPTVREDATQANFSFALVEDALGLERTPPPAPAGPDAGDGESELVEIDNVEFFAAGDRLGALRQIKNLLEPTVTPTYEYFNQFVAAFETQDPTGVSGLSQEMFDALTEFDFDRLAAKATELRDEEVEKQLADFPEIQNRIRRMGGRDVGYFENILAELNGEVEPTRLPADSLEEIRQFSDALFEAKETVRQHINDLQQPDRGQRGGGRTAGGGGGRGGFSGGRTGEGLGPAPADRPDLGEKEPYTDTDRISGEEITRDPAFEEKFVELARDLGRARQFDLLPLPPDEYFRLTPERQEKFYDVTPFEFMRRSLVRDDVSKHELKNRYGFAPGEIPDVDTE